MHVKAHDFIVRRVMVAAIIGAWLGLAWFAPSAFAADGSLFIQADSATAITGTAAGSDVDAAGQESGSSSSSSSADSATGSTTDSTTGSGSSGASDTSTSSSANASASSSATSAIVPPNVDGWALDGDVWRYWKGGSLVKGQWISTDDAPSISGIEEGNHRYWIAKDGSLAIDRLINPESKNDDGAGFWAYATKYGYVATGKTVVGNKVYLASKKGKLESGDDQGFLVTKKYDGGKRQRYYINKKSHAAITGKVVKVPGWGKVFSMAKKGYVVRGVTRIDKTHVLLAGADGKLYQKSGWAVTGKFSKNGEKQRYWLEPTKKNANVYGARTGLFNAQGAKYYSSSTGKVFCGGYKQIKGSYYYAESDGALTKSDVVNRMVSLAQGYSSPSNYLIMVDTDDTKLIVFEGSQDNWKPKHIWDCSTGAPETPTVLGVFSVGMRGYSFGEDHGYSCYYWTQFYGDYLFHTRIYHANTHDLMDVSMNTRVSQGCVRLYDEDAYWIWTNIPTGTTVVTIE